MRIRASSRVVVLTALATSSPAMRARQNGLVAYTNEIHSSDLYSMNADGSGVQPLLRAPAPMRWPTLSSTIVARGVLTG